jgi:hypothetical protein
MARMSENKTHQKLLLPTIPQSCGRGSKIMSDYELLLLIIK